MWPHHCPYHVFRMRVPLQALVVLDNVHGAIHLVAEELGGAFGDDGGRCDGIYPDFATAQFAGKAAGESDHGSF